MKNTKLIITAAVSALALAAVIFIYFSISYNQKLDAEANDVANIFYNSLKSRDYSSIQPYLDSGISISRIDNSNASVSAGIISHVLENLNVTSFDSVKRTGKEAVFTFSCELILPDSIIENVSSSFNEKMKEELDKARTSDEIYDEDFNFRKDVSRAVFDKAVLSETDKYNDKSVYSISVILKYTSDEGWKISDIGVLYPYLSGDVKELDSLLDKSFDAAFSSLEYIRKIYTLPLDSHVGNMPDKELFHESSDPKECMKMLDSFYAKQLLKGKEPYFNESLNFIPGAPIYWYLDESILVIVWQEACQNGTAGTYSEVVLGDGSQLCRKIVNDKYDSNAYIAASSLARQTNSVLAIGGDLYDHPGRLIGVHVYDGEVMCEHDETCDTCMFTTEGDVLFTYRNQFSSIDEARDFVKNNNVRFSVSFGPAIIDKGQSIAPSSYAWGEINDTYARGAIGMREGDLGHFLCLNMNEQEGYWQLSTLQDEINEMLAHNVTKAYALDGGQTCCTVFNGKLINRVQFNKERGTSDIIFFGSAVPEKQ